MTLSENYASPTISVIQLMKTNQLLKMHKHYETNENQKLESISKNLTETKIDIKRFSDNITNLRDG